MQAIHQFMAILQIVYLQEYFIEKAFAHLSNEKTSLDHRSPENAASNISLKSCQCTKLNTS